MDGIAAVDGRFNYDADGSWLNDIKYNDGELALCLYGMYFMFNVNGVGAWNSFDQEFVSNGDFIKWGDESCGTEIAQWTYVWTQVVEPVSVYDAVNENGVASLSIYPNPAVNETFVTIESAGMNEVSVYDMQGRLMSKQSVLANEGELVRISTESMAGGVYFVTVSNESIVRVAKLVVK